MNNYQIKKTMRYFTAGLGLGLLLMQPMSIVADDRNGNAYNNYSDDNHDLNSKIKHINGITVTGVNNVLGKPVYNWGEPFGTFNFPTLFIYNEYGTEPLPIDENTLDSAILASGISPIFSLAAGHDIKPEWINVPLRDVAVLTDFANIEKESLRSLRDADPLELSQSEPADPITLGQWMEASGDLKIKCSDDGADVKLRMRNLIPKRIYSVWATIRLPPEPPTPGSGPKAPSFPLPVGGVPNTFMTDKYGDATFERRIKFCPLDAPSTDNPSALNIDVLFHANHQTYGAVPTTGFVPGEWQGVIQFSHVVFPINVELLDN